MADFNDLDEKKLEELRKALLKQADTTTARQPWQEHFDRQTTVEAAKSVLAADVIKGFAGSWASSYNYGRGARITPGLPAPTGFELNFPDGTVVPIPERAKTTKLGQRGLPDIDFVPYSHRTNRFASKGPSLVGHPISFEVVGPTLKSPFCDWTWSVASGAGPNGGDLLTMDTRPDGTAATCANLLSAYGPDVPTFTAGDAAEPNGGLYVIITDDGVNPGSIPLGQTPMGALPGRIDTARYELFRVISWRDDQIELAPNKPLSTAFDLPPIGVRYIRAITVVRPYVTRLAAIPGSGPAPGREQVYAVVSPERAASSDLYPPYDGGTPGDGTWLQGGFDINPGSQTPSGVVGSSASYMGRNTLPVPIPFKVIQGTVETTAAALPSSEIGEWDITVPTGGSPSDTGRVVNVYNIDTKDNLPLTFGTRAATLGWFPVTYTVPGVGDPYYRCQRVVEVDPTSGHTYFGPGPYYQDLLATGPQHNLTMTVHDPVLSIWFGNFDVDKVQACRLKNLIDPNEVSRTDKKYINSGSLQGAPAGAGAGRADRAIFDTSRGSNVFNPAVPGSLLDLGFRMVLFPAKEDAAGAAVPDFDKPIDTRGEVLIDASIDASEQQYVEVDYSAGLVRLSHPPPTLRAGIPDFDTDIDPNGIVGQGANNPREEVVLFAACVPYSMEEGQIGTGNRVVARDGLLQDFDVFGERVIASVDLGLTNGVAGAPFVGPSGVAPNPVEIVLDRLWDGPSSGVIEITNATGLSYGKWGYTETRTVTNGAAEDVTALGGISSLPTTITDPSLSGGDPRLVILRREVFFGETSANKDFGIDNWTLDTTYGSSSRASTLRVKGGTVKKELDGSTTIDLTGGSPIPPSSAGFEFLQHGHVGASPQLDSSGFNELANAWGMLAPVQYESTGNPLNPSTSTYSFGATKEGPALSQSVVGLGDFAGLVAGLNGSATPLTSLLRVEQNLRLVAKFAVNPSGADVRFFVGLLGTVNPGGAPVSPSSASADPVLPDNRFAGFRVNGGGSTPLTAQFYSQGPLGNYVSPVIPAFVEGGIYYMVLETNRSPAEGKLTWSLYDADYNLVAQASNSNPISVPEDSLGMSFVVAHRRTSLDGSRPEHSFYYAAVKTRADLDM